MSDLRIFGQSLPEIFDRFRSEYYPFKDLYLYPPIDIAETETDLVIKAEVPGINPADLEIYLSENGVLLKGISTETLETTDKGYKRFERRSGSFERTINYPTPVLFEQAHASLNNGLLELRIPKDPSKIPKVKKLTVKTDNGQ